MISDDWPFRVLVVDDEERVRSACRRVLEGMGFVVREAANGREGLEAISRFLPDLVLVDLMMPVMDGMEMLKRAREQQPDLAVVVITGFATLDKAVEAMKGGADDFLAKPFKPRDLRLVVQRVLKRVRTVQDMTIEKSRMRALVDSMSNGVLVVDAAAKLALVNPALRTILGWGREDHLGQPVFRVLPCPEVLEAIEEVLESEDSTPEPIVCLVDLERGGETIHLQVRCVPFLDGRGHLVGALAVFEDVTALRRLDQMKDEFVSMVAHEIASPLGSVMAQLQTLAKGIPGPLNQKQLHLVERALARVGGIVKLSKDLLNIAKIEAGTLGRVEEVELGPILEEAVDMLRPRAQEKGQSLGLELEPGLAPIRGVGRAILEVAVNLVSNAIKYTPEGGRIRVRAWPREDGVAFAVSDTGFGLAPEDQKRIFQRFYRVRDAQTRDIVGTGLGMSIVKKVVEEHRGRIEVESERGKGSTFTVILPRSGPEGD